MRRPPLALTASFVIVGFLLVVTGNATSVASQTEEPRRQALVDQVVKQRSNVDDLDKAVAELRTQVSTAQNNAGQASARQDAANQEQAQLAMLAGTVAVQGPGITVKVSDAPKPAGDDGVKFDANRIQDKDIQLIVNALFAAGAEAVSVNENRVVAVTPIRAAGGTIVVNYRPVSSPYRIDAVGADKSRFSASEIAGHFELWKSKYSLGYELSSNKKLSLPGYSGRVSIDLAVPPTTATTENEGR